MLLSPAALYSCNVNALYLIHNAIAHSASTVPMLMCKCILHGKQRPTPRQCKTCDCQR